MRFVFILLLASIVRLPAAENAAGRWEGTVQIPERDLNLVIDLAPENSTWNGSAILSGMGLKGIPLSDIKVQGTDVSFAIKTGRGLQIDVKGKIDGADAFSGNFSVGGNNAPLALKKTGPAQVEPVAHSTAIAKEAEGEWKGDYEMFGYPRHVTIKLTNRTPAEGANAEFVVVGRKTNNLPVDLVTQEGDLLTIDSHETGISFEGRLNKGTNELKGLFLQGPVEVPLLLRRSK